MKLYTEALLAAAGMVALSWSPVHAAEVGAVVQTKPGSLIGTSAGVPPPGIYMFDQVFTYQANLTGPGTTTVLGGSIKTGYQAAVDQQGFLFVPGWNFLGATYDAVIVQPFVMLNIGAPVNTQFSGVHNTYLVPVELSWMLGTSGFGVKTGLGIFAPDGTTTGPTGTGNIGAPYWIFQPELIVSYLKDGWNLSAAIYEESIPRIPSLSTGQETFCTPTSPRPKRSANGRLDLSPITTDRFPTIRVRRLPV